MICPHCNAENREGAKFCDECGTRLTPATVELPAIDPEPSSDEEAEEHAVEDAGTSGDELLSALPDVEAPAEADLDGDASEADASGCPSTTISAPAVPSPWWRTISPAVSPTSCTQPTTTAGISSTAHPLP